MDAFFASVEQQVNPALRGKPVIIGGRNNKYRSIICAASYEAKARGIENAMPSWKALKICPDAIFVPADTTKYVYTSDQIFQILQNFCPQVEKFSVDEFFLDIDGCQGLFGSALDMGLAIKKKIKQRFGLTCTVGVAPSRITAKLAAKLHKPDGIAVLSKKEVLTLLTTLPVEKICGIGPRLKERFHYLGVYTCGDLVQYPNSLLKKQFGVVGLWLKAACLVEDISDIPFFADGKPKPKSVGHSQTLRYVSTDQDFIHDWFYLLSEMVAQRLRRQKLQGRTVYIYVADGFKGGHSKRKTFIEPTYDGYEIYQRCLEIIDIFPCKELLVRVLGVSVSNLEPANAIYLFDKDIKRERLIQSIDHINNKHGEWTVYPASLRCARY